MKKNSVFLIFLALTSLLYSTLLANSGTKKIAVILVNFTGNGESSGEPDIGINPGYVIIRTYLQKLIQYYSENSYGKLNIQISTFPSDSSAYTLSNSISYYGGGTSGLYTERDSYYLIRDAINMANNQSVNISTANFDMVMVLHAGYGEESGGVAGDIWSLNLKWAGIYPALNGFIEGVIVPALEIGNASPLGMICHNFGHYLGLPDLYDTTAVVGGTQTRVGKWCLMDRGAWAGIPPGGQPSHLSPWCKKYLGWLSSTNIMGDIPSSQVINSKTGVVFYPSETSNSGIYKIPIDVGSGAEYFLLEYRHRAEPNAIFDKGLPGEGILIWHIDDTVGKVDDNNVNISSSHPRVALEPADKTPSWFYNNQGDFGDPFREGTQFTDPESRAYNGAITGISVLDFTGSDSSQMTADISRIIIQIPILSVSPTALEFGETKINETKTLQLLVSNTGSGISSGTITTDKSWITVNPDSFNGNSVTVSVTVNATGMKNGDYTGTLNITSNGGDATVTVTVKATCVLVYPNPYSLSSGKKLTFWGSGVVPNDTKIRIYTLGSDLVKTLSEDIGNDRVTWDGKNDDGDKVVPGIYLYVSESPKERSVGRITVIK